MLGLLTHIYNNAEIYTFLLFLVCIPNALVALFIFATRHYELFLLPSAAVKVEDDGEA